MGEWGSGVGQGLVGQGLFALSRVLNPMGTTEHSLERDTSSGYGSSTEAVVLCWFHIGMVMDVGYQWSFFLKNCLFSSVVKSG